MQFTMHNMSRARSISFLLNLRPFKRKIARNANKTLIITLSDVKLRMYCYALTQNSLIFSILFISYIYSIILNNSREIASLPVYNYQLSKVY